MFRVRCGERGRFNNRKQLDSYRHYRCVNYCPVGLACTRVILVQWHQWTRSCHEWKRQRGQKRLTDLFAQARTDIAAGKRKKKKEKNNSVVENSTLATLHVWINDATYGPVFSI